MYDLKATEAFRVVRRFATILCAWPYDESKIGRVRASAYKIMWCIALANGCFAGIPVYLNVYVCRNQLIELLQTLAFANTGGETILNIIMMNYYKNGIAVRFSFCSLIL